MPADKIRALTDQLLRSETPEIAVTVAAHLQAAIREFLQELSADAELVRLLPGAPTASEQARDPN